MNTNWAGLELHSLISERGILEVSLKQADVGALAPNEIVIRVQAAPINPSDLGLLFGAADLTTVKAFGAATLPSIEATVPPHLVKAMGARVGHSMPVGNEGAGTVVAAGSPELAEALLGKTVAVLAGGMYSQFRRVKADDCLVFPSTVTPREAASSFVNPLTSLGMVETMRNEGHAAIVHTAAASNLGQMLNRLCIKDSVPLVNIVRSPAQAELLRAAGAKHVCDTTASTFVGDLTEAIAATRATIAFDAIGGGKLVGQILTAMEVAASGKGQGYSVYGTTTMKQAYIYGSLDPSPTEFKRSFGMAWRMGGWLLFPFLANLDGETKRRLKSRVSEEILTTFASGYEREISLSQALDPEMIKTYASRRTGAKVLINPALG